MEAQESTGNEHYQLKTFKLNNIKVRPSVMADLWSKVISELSQLQSIRIANIRLGHDPSIIKTICDTLYIKYKLVSLALENLNLGAKEIAQILPCLPSGLNSLVLNGNVVREFVGKPPGNRDALKRPVIDYNTAFMDALREYLTDH